MRYPRRLQPSGQTGRGAQVGVGIDLQNERPSIWPDAKVNPRVVAAAQQAKGAQLVRYEDDATMALAFASGQVDILATARSLLPAISKKNPARTAESRITMQTFYLAIGMRKDEPKLKEWVNGWVKSNLQNGQLGAIYKKYHGVEIPVEQLLKAGN